MQHHSGLAASSTVLDEIVSSSTPPSSYTPPLSSLSSSPATQSKRGLDSLRGIDDDGDIDDPNASLFSSDVSTSYEEKFVFIINYSTIYRTNY